MGWLVGAQCASWPTRSADRYTGPWNATTKHPILGYRHPVRPVTPLRNARLAARRLGNADLVVHDGYGHLTRRDPSTCITQAVGSHLVDLTTHPRGPSAPLTAAPSTPTSANPSPSRSCWEACASGPWTTAGAAALQSSGTTLIGRGGLCEPMPWQSATSASRRASSPRSVGGTAVPSRVARWGGRSLPRRPAGRKAAAATRG